MTAVRLFLFVTWVTLKLQPAQHCAVQFNRTMSTPATSLRRSHQPSPWLHLAQFKRLLANEVSRSRPRVPAACRVAVQAEGPLYAAAVFPRPAVDRPAATGLLP
jgi:hypothetical protein